MTVPAICPEQAMTAFVWTQLTVELTGIFTTVVVTPILTVKLMWVAQLTPMFGGDTPIQTAPP